MKIIQVITTTFLVLLLCNSCQKNTVDDSPVLTQIKPTVKDGRLNFASVEELRQYYSDIENAMKEAEDEEAVLKSFESQYNYVPLRTVRVTPNNVTLRNDDYEYLTTEELLNELKYDFIGDPVLQSVLNTYYEVGVESNVMVFMNGDQTFTIPQSNVVAINELRDLNKTEAEIPMDFLRQHPDVTYESPTKSYTIGMRVTAPSPSTVVYGYDPDFAVSNLNCDPYTRVFSARLFEIAHDDNNTPNDNTDDINTVIDYNASSFEFIFGDGSTEVVNNNNEAEVSHVYSSGTYNITIRVNYTDRGGVARSSVHTETVNIDVACQEEDFDVSEMIQSSDDSKCITTKLWYNRNIFGTHLGSFTKSYRWDSSREKWRRERADIDVRIWGSLRDDGCDIHWNDEDYDFDGNSRWVDAKMHCPFQYANRQIGDGDIYSHHTANFDDGTFLENDLILEPCQ